MKNAAWIMLSFAVGGGLFAQDGYWASIQGGGNIPFTRKGFTSSRFDAGTIFGVGTGKWLTPRWGAELTFLSSRHLNKDTRQMGDEHHVCVSALYQFSPRKPGFYPFARLGMGVTSMGKELFDDKISRERLHWHVGLGAQAFVDKSLWSFAELRAVRISALQSSHNDLFALIGMGYRWGGKPVVSLPQALPAPVAETTAPGANH